MSVHLLVMLPIVALLAALAALAPGQPGGASLAALVVAGAVAGIALQRAGIGFAGSWRALVVEGRTRAFRVQIGLSAGLGLLLLPLLILTPETYKGAAAPVGIAMVLGSFLFGVGMHMAGTCASGALYTAGAGHLRALIVLAGFVLGVTLAAATFETWSQWPRLETITLADGHWSLGGALMVHGAIAVAVITLAALYERRRRGTLESWHAEADRGATNRWPLAVGAAVLGVAMLAIVLVQGRPWALVSAYGLWGSHLAERIGLEPTFWEHWAHDPLFIERPILSDASTIIDISVFLGALLAAVASGSFRWRGALPLVAWLPALLGGVVMGFGARLATGCNIGAFVGGIASGSLHGWVWLLGALAGTGAAVGLVAFARGLRQRPAASPLAAPWGGLSRPAAEIAGIDRSRP